MSPRSSVALRVVSALLVMLALTTAPAWAQDGSDTGGSGSDVSGSDVAGAISQSSRIENATFASDAVQQRVNAMAVVLQQRLVSGAQLTSTGSIRITAAPAPLLAELLSRSTDNEAAIAYVAGQLEAYGISDEHSERLTKAVAGLIAGGEVEAPALVRATNAFNELVDAAPASFLLDPPDSFIVIQDVLTSLLDASSMS
ncbi:hypothetical protein CRI94_03925 [Longibacter salinarum]|uniref:DUF4197 domain-containing protein n=1 Tax=Longibacter salinarum TaxID=1850348 RepID=A0A2A8D066_9BACT|nr:hypothetical protein [Longibacter salinarum]PEN14197.1 hypothetical protein CRI94_03925 [Longibacter salinarum]